MRYWLAAFVLAALLVPAWAEPPTITTSAGKGWYMLRVQMPDRAAAEHLAMEIKREKADFAPRTGIAEETVITRVATARFVAGIELRRGYVDGVARTLNGAGYATVAEDAGQGRVLLRLVPTFPTKSAAKRACDTVLRNTGRLVRLSPMAAMKQVKTKRYALEVTVATEAALNDVRAFVETRIRVQSTKYYFQGRTRTGVPNWQAL